MTQNVTAIKDWCKIVKNFASWSSESCSLVDLAQTILQRETIAAARPVFCATLYIMLNSFYHLRRSHRRRDIHLKDPKFCECFLNRLNDVHCSLNCGCCVLNCKKIREIAIYSRQFSNRKIFLNRQKLHCRQYRNRWIAECAGLLYRESSSRTDSANLIIFKMKI